MWPRPRVGYDRHIREARLVAFQEGRRWQGGRRISRVARQGDSIIVNAECQSSSTPPTGRPGEPGARESSRRGAPPEAPPRVSVVVPTLNESQNIDDLIRACLEGGRAASLDLELIVVDDGSRDGTRERVRAWEKDHPVRLIEREREGGLAGAVLAGASRAGAGVVVVMDADLSHPPDKIGELARPVLDGTHDMVIGSRYVPGGDTPGWPFLRRLASRCGALAAWPLADVRDPMSGFFAVKRDCLLELGGEAKGFKIGLEILTRGGEGLRVMEVPIVFHDRIRGESKIGPAVVGTYLKQLATLAGGDVSKGNALRFAVAGLTGLAVDLGLFHFLHQSGVSLGPSHLTSFSAAVVVTYVLNSRWAFARAARDRSTRPAGRYLLFFTVALLAVLLRGGVLAFSARTLGLPPTAALLPAILVAAVVNYLGCAFLVFAPAADPGREYLRWRVAAMGVLGYLCALRLVYLGQIDLLREEAYYWNYSQHPALGYLDHPPMVAWLIWLGTHIFGHNEFGVRIGAQVCWLIALVFSFLLARNLAGKTAAFLSAMLVGVLPFFFSVGVLMVPDAPLMACWSAALYFLERALLGERPAAWWGVGAALGLGLLSKYTIVLLGLALLCYLVLHPTSRRWLRRPEPYGAALLAALLFLPVILWNARNDWASFVFQGPGRLARTGGFALPVFVVSLILLITPAGLAGVILGMLRRGKRVDAPGAEPVEDGRSFLADRSRAFVLVFTLVPLLVFLVTSLRMASKLNWTGPTWLAALPAMAMTMMAGTASGGKAAGSGDASRRMHPQAGGTFLARSWKATIVVLMLSYGLVFHYPVLGIPGVHLPPSDYTMNWRELGRRVAEIKMDVLRRTGRLPLVVGMQRYELSSELAFYDPGGDGAQDTAAPHLFGKRGLMYEYWFPRRLQEGRILLLVGANRSQIDSLAVEEHVERLDPIHEIRLTRNGSPAGHFYWRLAHTYRETPRAVPGRG